MTIQEAIGIDNNYCDIKTGQHIGFRKSYEKLVEYLGGLDVVAQCIPFETDVLVEKTQKDPDLNNTPIRKWDAAAGFKFCGQRDYTFEPTPLSNILSTHGITLFSCSECVCLLKETARLLVEQKTGEYTGNAG